MKRIFFGLFVFIGLILAAGMSSAVSAQSVSGSIGNGTVKRGGATKGTIVMSIPAGLHVNSNTPNSKYAIPTTVRLSSPDARVSAVSYPRGKNQKFQFSDSAINVYDGRVAFTFNVTVPASFKGKTVRVRAVVRYQACTDEVCYPPKTQDITLTASVR